MAVGANRALPARVRSWLRLVRLAALASAALGLLVAPAVRASPYVILPAPAELPARPAYRYANMSDAEAMGELDRRGVPYARLGEVPGVRAPVRLTGPLHGVLIHSSLPPAERAASIFEILDARLALALDDFAQLLVRHEIDEVVHFTMYRPNVAKPAPLPPDRGRGGGVEAQGADAKPKRPASCAAKTEAATGPAATKKKRFTERHRDARKVRSRRQAPAACANGPQAKKAGPRMRRAAPAPERTGQKRPAERAPKVAGDGHAGEAGSKDEAGPPPAAVHKWAAPGTRHPAGLAIDIGALHRRDGAWLRVAHHFPGKIGTHTCGPGGNEPSTPAGRELAAIVCEAAEIGIFTYVLTPNFDHAHADHFHMEIKPGVRWLMYY
ncbi:MAG: extensin family protein [Deltaproteobacteria bacterium]|nr:extensin family protein [Deltaproteobacteria bacterium]